MEPPAGAGAGDGFHVLGRGTGWELTVSLVGHNLWRWLPHRGSSIDPPLFPWLYSGLSLPPGPFHFAP